jgi:hypothetical protein
MSALSGQAGIIVTRRDVGQWPILLKKSVKGVGPIFSASLARFLSRDAEDLIGWRRSDVDRPKWNCEAINRRFQISARFELICAAPLLGTFSTESANCRHVPTFQKIRDADGA